MKMASRCPLSMALRRCANLGSSLKLMLSSAASPGLSLKLLGLMVYLSLLLALISPSTDALVVLVMRTVWECACVCARMHNNSGTPLQAAPGPQGMAERGFMGV